MTVCASIFRVAFDNEFQGGILGAALSTKL